MQITDKKKVTIQRNLIKINGVIINKLAQSMIQQKNTVYTISYDFDLTGKTITVPEGCILLFNGGTINNGTVMCQETDIQKINKFPDAGNATFDGTFKVGLMLSMDNTMKWWTGTEWKEIDGDLSEVNAAIGTVESASTASATVAFDKEEKKFTFNFSLPKGDKGDTGANGIDGESKVTNYIWIKYSDYSDGTDMYDTPTSTTEYIGIAANKTTSVESDDKTDYTWSRFKGDKGDPGIDSHTFQTVFAFKCVEEKPAAPTGGSWDNTTGVITYPEGWSSTDTQTSECHTVWMSNAVFREDNIITRSWSDPLRITGDSGTNGTNGEDGDTVEFVYKLTKTELVTPTIGESVQSKDAVPDGWTDNPQPITQEYPIGWVSTRTGSNTTWSSWSTPSIWSKYGVNGMDGDGVEYVFKLEQYGVQPDAITEISQEREFIPEGWTDNPTGVNSEIRYEWVSTRLYSSTTKTWGAFSSPALWAVFSLDGSNGSNGKSVVTMYAKSTGSSVVPVLSPSTRNPGSVWGSVIPEYTGTEAIWGIQGVITYDNLLEGEWQGPYIITGINGKDGTPPNYKTYIYKSSTTQPVKPSFNDPENLSEGWVDYPTSIDNWWQCIGTVNGVTKLVTEWSEVIPLNGKDGTAQDGKYTEFRFKSVVSTAVSVSIDSTSRNPDGWTVSIPTVNSGYALWMTTAVINPDNTLYTDWNTPVRISGEQGPKGDTGPAGERGPAGSQGVSGIPGVSIEPRYCLGTTTSYLATFNTTVSQTRNPSSYGWEKVLPTTTSSNPVIWCIQAKIGGDSGDDLETSWCSPFQLNGINGLQGEKGEKGDQGVQGLQGIQGETGEQGIQGETGISSYFHIKYSDNPDGTDMNELDGEYIGTYVDFTQSDSDDKTKYTWVKIKGAQGVDGTNGIAGENGLDGKTSYLHIKYSNDNGATFTSNNGEDVGDYIGIYVDFTLADSTDTASYKWSKTKGETGIQGLQGLQGEQGEQGIKGTDGTDGASTYFHVKYSDYADGTDMNETGGIYIGTYVDYIEDDSTDKAKYRWILIKGSQGDSGEQGIPGVNGADGETSYLHIKYSDDNGLTFTSNNGEDAGKYIGQYVDFTLNDSSSVSDYKWALIKGEKGDQGIQGLQGIQGPKGEQGIQGVQGETTYFHIKYSDSPDGTDMTESGGDYIGTYVDFTSEDSTDKARYNWVLVKGAQGTDGTNGIAGINGADGSTTYLHIKYSNDGGVTFTSNSGEDTGDYLGQYTDFILADSTDVSSYKWSKIKGEQGVQGAEGIQGIQGVQGEQGVQGPSGLNGKTTYFHIKYSENSSGTPMTETPSVYIGTYVDYIEEDSTVYTDYRWSKFQGSQGANGSQGIPGTNGENGKTSYLHIAYANSSDGSVDFDVSASEGKEYIGQYTDFEMSDSTDYTAYKWTKIKGEQGIQGLQGLQGEQGIQGIQGDNGRTTYFHVKYATDASGSNMSETSGDYIGTYVDYVEDDSTSASDYTWRLIKGVQGETGEQGIPGTNGENGLTSYLHIKYSDDGGYTFTSNNGETSGSYIGQYVDFISTDSTVTTDYKWSLIKGSNGKGISYIVNRYLISSSSSGITSSTSGWSTSVVTPTASKSYLWNYETTWFTDGSYSSTTPHVVGVYGDEGKGLSNIVEYYLVSSSYTGVTTSTSGWSTSIPTITSTNKYLWNYEKVSYTDNTSTETTPKVIGVYGDKGDTGDTGNGISLIIPYFLATPLGSGVTPSTSGWSPTVQAINTTNKYLWRYDKIQYTNGTYTVTAPYLSGVYSAQGKRGQVVYPAGVYNTSTEYITTELKAPYVYDTKDGQFYVLNAQMSWIGDDQNGLYPSEDYAANNGTYWLLFTSFEALYTKIGIIANGLIGSAVFNGDFMFSQQGKNASGTSVSNYENFNDADPVNSTNSFSPNFCVNLKTGKLYCNNADIKGAITATSGTFSNISSPDGSFVIDSTGKAILTNANVTGTINATSGTFENVTINTGTVGGFEITSTQLNSTATTTITYGGNNYTETYSMLITSNLLRFMGPNSAVYIGSDTWPASSGGALLSPQRIEVNRSITGTIYGNTGLYISVQGAAAYDNVGYQFTGNHALYIPKGNICGMRYRVRRISTSQTLTAMDTVLLCINTSDITLTLPTTNIEDGQFYIIRKVAAGNITISGTLRWSWGSNTTSNVTKNADLTMLIYDSVNKFWTCNYMGN